jgi:hypothetical protein
MLVAGTVEDMNFYSTYFSLFHRAMGFFYVMVTHPFEECLRKGSILDLNEDFAVLHESLKSWSKDGSLLLSRESPLFKYDDDRLPLAETEFGK